jgi:hypothetical protein
VTSDSVKHFADTVAPKIVLLVPAVLAALAMLLCWHVAGNSLGFFFGGFFVAVLVAPAAIFSAECVRSGILPVALTALAIAVVWLAGVNRDEASFGEWLELGLIVLCVSFALAGLSGLLGRYLGQTIAIAVVVLLGLAWLTWPVWLCTYLAKSGSQKTADVLVEISPLLTTNGVLKNESPISERTVAYQLTNLNQDIAMSLPDSPWKCAGFHALIAAGCFGLIYVVKRRDRLNARRARISNSESMRLTADSADERG